jgi:hypothetical protein
MNASQQNKLAMYLTVRNVCNGSPAVWAALPAFATNFTAFEGLVDTISSLAQAQATTKEGVTVQKQTMMKALLDQTMVVSGALAALAVVTADAELEGKAGFTRSELVNLRDAEIDDRAEAVLGLATTHLAELAAYGVVQATLDTLDARIEAYSAMVEAPRSATVKVKSITQTIMETFEKADRVLKGVLDRLAIQFQAGAPAFHADYLNARTIVDRPGGIVAKPEPAPVVA